VPGTTTIPALPLTGIQAVSHGSARDGSDPAIVELTRRLATSDEMAFREFHALYFNRLYQFLLAVTRGDEHAAQDALQETMLRVARYAREFEAEEIFWSWLKAIARNVVRDGGRRRRRYLAVLERFGFWRHESADFAARDNDDPLRASMEEALADLAPHDRQLIEGKYLRGATVVELAADTGLTEKAVESRLSRIRRRLADVLLEKLRRQ
jgi:RNA polymerase sigma-70 factor, ECF subfamily